MRARGVVTFEIVGERSLVWTVLDVVEKQVESRPENFKLIGVFKSVNEE